MHVARENLLVGAVVFALVALHVHQVDMGAGLVRTAVGMNTSHTAPRVLVFTVHYHQFEMEVVLVLSYREVLVFVQFVSKCRGGSS